MIQDEKSDFVAKDKTNRPPHRDVTGFYRSRLLRFRESAGRRDPSLFRVRQRPQELDRELDEGRLRRRKCDAHRRPERFARKIVVSFGSFKFTVKHLVVPHRFRVNGNSKKGPRIIAINNKERNPTV